MKKHKQQPSTLGINRRASYARALTLYQRNRLDEARQICEQLLATKSNHAETLNLLGVIETQQGQYRVGVEHLQRAVDLDPNNASYHSNLGLAQHKLGRMEEAIVSHRTALRLQLDYLDAAVNLSNSLYQTQRLDEALELLNHWVSRYPDAPTVHNNLGIVYHLKGMDEQAEYHWNKALLLEPNNADAHTNIGLLLIHQGKLEQALQSCQKAFQLKPDDINIVNNLGEAYAKNNQRESAIQMAKYAIKLQPNLPNSYVLLGNLHNRNDQNRPDDYSMARFYYQKAIEIAPNHCHALNNLGVLLRLEGKLDEAEKLFRKVNILDLNNANAYNNLGVTLAQDRERWHEAEECYIKALQLQCNYTDALWNLSTIYLGTGRLKEGWAAYEQRFNLPNFDSKREFISCPKWDGQLQSHGRLMIWCEQGIGDEFIFSSCYADALARVGQCIIECQPRLIRLFQRSFPRALVRADSCDAHRRETIQPPDFDYHIPAGSLFGLFRQHLNDFPKQAGFLCADPEQVNHWQHWLDSQGEGLKVGICWRSGLLTGSRNINYTQLEEWTDILNVPGVTFVNLQYSDCEVELQEIEAATGIHILRPPLDLRDDQDGLAALMSSLDLVISAVTAVMTLAGAMGVRTWSIGLDTDWAMLGTNYYPCYPNTHPYQRSLRQPWTLVLEQIVGDLRALTLSADHRLGWRQRETQRLADQAVTMAEAHYQRGETDQAVTLCQEILNLDADHGPACLLLARMASRFGQYERALRLLEPLLQQHPEDSERLCDRELLLSALHSPVLYDE